MKARDVIRLSCVVCGAQEYYPRAMEVQSITALHTCRGSVNAMFSAPMELETAE